MIPTLQLGQLGRSQQDVMAGGSDASFANVVLLLHGNGANASTTAIDSSSYAHAITANGTAQLSTTSPKFGSASLSFDGTNTCYFKSPDAAEYNIGTGDVTVEGWVYFNALSANRFLTGKNRNSAETRWQIDSGSGTNTIALIRNDVAIVERNFTWATATWYHFAWSRVSGTSRLFVNGTLLGAGVADTNTYTSPAEARHGNNGASKCLNGRLDDIRWTVGVGRYSASFTPPVAAFPDA